ncbi:MAG: polysaccharide deacetylase family protein, partial [Spirochaetales bacterium]|nr:polysaccharide deacetylase family protein [Spirochaetales bacterium]
MINICSRKLKVILVLASVICFISSFTATAQNCSGYYALAFDDGPNSNTNTLVGILNNAGAKATFFPIGQNISSNMAAFNTMLNAGMKFGNHSFTHSHMTSWSYQQVYDDLNRAQQAIQNAGGGTPTLFRPPYLEVSSTIQQAASALGLTIVTCDVDVQDWNGASTSQIVSTANNIQNGGVFLMHDGYSSTNGAIPTIVSNLSNRGLCAGMINNNGDAVAWSGSVNPTPDPTTVPTAGPTPIPGTMVIACGNSSGVGNFLADQYYSGGETYNNSNIVNVSLITTDTPPAELFNNERYGAMSYTIPGFTSGNSYIVTLYFAETYLTSSGSRVFNVSVNGTAVLSNFDIYAAAGGQDIAIAREITTAANSSGQIVIQFTSVTENPKINGISIKPGSGSTTAPTTVPTSAPTAVTTTAPTVPPGDCNVSFNPQNSSQGLNSTFTVDVVVNSGNQELAAYGITFTYNIGILSFVDIEEGIDGFLAAVNTNYPGEIVASGFDSS